MSAHFVRTILTAGIVSVALAASADTPVQPQPKDPNMPAPHNTVPDKIEGGAGDTTGSTGTLSDRLEKSDGVIKPPETGAGRVIQPPGTATMPVIPPPGTPGSRTPNAEPK